MVDLGFNGDDMIIFVLSKTISKTICDMGSRLGEGRMGERKLVKCCYNSPEETLLWSGI